MSEGTGEMGEQRARRTEPAKPSTPTTSETTDEPRTTQTELAKPGTPVIGDAGVVWVRFTPSQVVRTIVIALLTAAVVLGALFLLWQVRPFIGWFVIALFLAAALNPAVRWLERRHRMIKRSLAIVLTYLGLVVGLVLIVAIFVPVLIEEIGDLINFIVAAVQAPEGPTEYLRGIADQYGLGGLFDRLSGQISDLPSRLGDLAKSVLLSVGGIAISAAGFVASLVTILTLTFFMILGSERFVNGGVRLFPEPQRPLVRSILGQSAGAVSGYITGNLAISFVAGVTTFIVLVVLGMPYPAALALLVAVLDLIPLVGATLGATIVVVVALFVAWWKALILLVFFLVYQQFEGSVLQPLVYSRAVHLDGLTIFVAVLVGGLLLGIPGALLAIPVAEIIRIVVTDLVEHRSRLAEAEAAVSTTQNEPDVPAPPQPPA
jgi:predicted PurR-regulated permease PerM